MLKDDLSPEQQEILKRERDLLTDLLVLLGKLRAPESEQENLKRVLLQLDELFLLVVVGEFNAGKSALINALLGESVLEEGVTPTTTGIHWLQQGEPGRAAQDAGTDILTHPSPLLKYVDIVDTPGTNAIHQEHEAITSDFVPRSDLVLFVTSADRPFTESERRFLEKIRDWGKKILFVVNKIDILATEKEREKVLDFVREHARQLLGHPPEIFAVSARRALASREKVETGGDPGFDRLVGYISATLDEEERLRLKLLSPVGVGRQLAEKYRDSMAESLAEIEGDVELLETIERLQHAYAEDLSREFDLRLSDVENVLHELERRGDDFFDERLRLSRVVELLNRSKLESDFKREVIGEMPRSVETKLADLIDWLVEMELNHWQNLMGQFRRQKTRISERVAPDVTGRFHSDRAQLIRSLGEKAKRTLEGYDREVEAHRLSQRVQEALAGTALAEVGAIGLGTAVGLMATSTLVDVTGILAAGTLAVLGLFVLPSRRNQAKKELREKVEELRKNLLQALRVQFERESRRSLDRVRQAMDPYSRFVRTEKERFEAFHRRLQAISDELKTLRTLLQN